MISFYEHCEVKLGMSCGDIFIKYLLPGMCLMKILFYFRLLRSALMVLNFSYFIFENIIIRNYFENLKKN